jgi:hypothetical protein
MPVKNKIRLERLTVSSFVTELGKESEKVKGGATNDMSCVLHTCVDCSIPICISGGGCPTYATCP